jgi:hypothetical protein
MRFSDHRPMFLAAALLIGAAACGPGDPPAADPAAGENGIPVAQEVYPVPDGAWDVHRADFEALLQRGRSAGVLDEPIPTRMIGFGEMFLGLPYVAHTLDLPGPERLVVNLKELDCVTLVENALALALAAPAGEYGEYLRWIEFIRYRGGELVGYTSRLHYFTDWIADNERKGLIRDVTRELGGVRSTKRISFMSENGEAYRQLLERPELVDSIRLVERALNEREWHWIPQDRIAAVEQQIQEGDIIGITTAIPGLDMSHTGLATWRNGRLHILHAPDVGQPVEISRLPLAERINRSRLQNGIVVARPLPAAR